jgi:hypothetical protein
VAHKLDEKLPTLKDTLKQLEALNKEKMRAQNNKHGASARLS